MTESSFLPEESTTIPPQKPVLQGNKGRILKAYTEAQQAVENATGIAMKPSMTLREFLGETRPKLNDAAKAFADLTYLAEKALYSPHEPELYEEVEAESLALTVKEMRDNQR